MNAAAAGGGRVKKSMQLISLLATSPREAIDRIDTIAKSALDAWRPHPYRYDEIGMAEAIRAISARYGCDVESLAEERELDEISGAVATRMQALQQYCPFTVSHNGDISFARMAYILIRAFRPLKVVETGTAYGVSSAFILQALQENGEGVLHSVDLPPLGPDADRYVGYLVPPDLRSRWVLHRGSARRVLPRLLADIGPIQMFVHDSLHTYEHMLWEFQTAGASLAGQACLLSDDIARNAAFQTWCDSARPTMTYAVSGVGSFHRPSTEAGRVFGLATL